MNDFWGHSQPAQNGPGGYAGYQVQQSAPPPPKRMAGPFFVEGEEAARCQQLPPWSWAIFFDVREDKFYRRETDEQGRPAPLQKFVFQPEPEPEPPQYVTMEQFSQRFGQLEKSFNVMIQRIDALLTPQASTTMEGMNDGKQPV